MTNKPTRGQKNLGPLTFGFDIGMASVGWAVLSPVRIVDLGVRAFDRAEDEKGRPLNENRRLMRTQRKRIRRRAQRLKKLRRLLRDVGLVATASGAEFDGALRLDGTTQGSDPWTLRADALDRPLTALDWARVLYHLVKRRGFYAARKSETVDDTKEGGRLTQGVKETQTLLGPPDQPRYRTLGELAAKDDVFATAKRNKAGDYRKSFSRELLRDELRQLFECQRRLAGC